jgi:formyl-CoA transferase
MQKSEFYRDARHDLPGPLAGIRVLELTTTWAGPLCGCVLADFGADVVKVEIPEGEIGRTILPMLPGQKTPVSFFHATVNRNKRSLTLDVRTEEGRSLFLRLARDCDVVVENFRPGVLDKWGIGYAALRADKADAILVSISAFGQFGPDSDQPGYDPIAQAASGFLSMGGAPDGPPVKAPTFLGDDLGGLHGALGALAALRHRDRTHEGQHVDVAMLDSILFQSNGFLTIGALGMPMRRTGNQYGYACPANVYACRDGSIYLAILIDAHWRALARLMGAPELAEAAEFATPAARHKNREKVNRVVSEWAATQAVAAVAESCRVIGVPASPVRSYAEAAAHPHVRERDMLQEVEQEGGASAPITGPAAKFSRSPTKIRSAAPALGEHTDEILLSVGLDLEAIEDLRRRRII